MCFYTIIAKCNEPLEAPHTPIDDDRYDVVDCRAARQPQLDLSNQLISYEALASLQHTQSICAVLMMCLYTIIAKCNELLEPRHAPIDGR